MDRHENYPEIVPDSNKQVVIQNPSERNRLSWIAPTTPPKAQKRICHLEAAVFATIVGLVVLLIGVVVAGGVGGGLAVRNCNNKLASLKNSTAATSTLPPTPSSSVIPSSNSTSEDCSLPVPKTYCGQPNFTSTYTTETNYVFNKTCFHTYSGSDIISFVALTWELCMEACGRYNYFKNQTNPTSCVGVSFKPSWINETTARKVLNSWDNCFLKYKVPDLNTLKVQRYDDNVVGTLNP